MASERRLKLILSLTWTQVSQDSCLLHSCSLQFHLNCTIYSTELLPSHTHTITGIGLFEVDKQDHVRKYEDVDAVSVFRYRENIKGQPPAFLECGGFVYPLIPGKSPVLKASERVYMFPELRKEGEMIRRSHKLAD